MSFFQFFVILFVINSFFALVNSVVIALINHKANKHLDNLLILIDYPLNKLLYIKEDRESNKFFNSFVRELKYYKVIFEDFETLNNLLRQLITHKNYSEILKDEIRYEILSARTSFTVSYNIFWMLSPTNLASNIANPIFFTLVKGEKLLFSSGYEKTSKFFTIILNAVLALFAILSSASAILEKFW